MSLSEQHSIGDEKQKTGGERDYPPMKSTEVPPKLMRFWTFSGSWRRCS